jgi:hypothetical protein
MAILSITEEWSGRTGGDDINESRHIRRFRVIFDNADAPENRPLIALYGGTDPEGHAVPSGFSAHEFNAWLIVVRRSYTALSPCVFDFEIEYSNRPGRSDFDSAAEAFVNPLDQPWDIEWFTSTISDRIDEDIHGNPIVNVNREPPDPPLQEEFACEGVRVGTAVSFWNHQFMAQYINAINSDYFWGYPPGQALCTQVGARRMRQGWLFYWAANCEILFNPLGWKRRVMQMGYRCRDWVSEPGYDSKMTSARDDDGNLVSQPVLLDDLGFKLVEGYPAKWLIFETKRSLPFSGLGLG